MKWITTLIGNIDRKNLVPIKVIAAVYNFCWSKKWVKVNELETDEEDLYRNPSKDFQVHRDEYERKNCDTESWMTRHDRNYLKLQKMYRADSTRIWRLDGNNNY